MAFCICVNHLIAHRIIPKCIHCARWTCCRNNLVNTVIGSPRSLSKWSSVGNCAVKIVIPCCPFGSKGICHGNRTRKRIIFHPSLDTRSILSPDRTTKNVVPIAADIADSVYSRYWAAFGITFDFRTPSTLISSCRNFFNLVVFNACRRTVALSRLKRQSGSRIGC